MQLEATARRRRIDALAQGDETDPQRVEILDQRHQVPQGAPEAVQSPAHQHVEPSPLRIPQQGIERRPAILRPADPGVDVFGGRPAARLTVAPEFRQLVLGRLLEG